MLTVLGMSAPFLAISALPAIDPSALSIADCGIHYNNDRHPYAKITHFTAIKMSDFPVLLIASPDLRMLVPGMVNGLRN